MISINEHIFNYSGHSISYLQIGDGTNLILAFHGFGMDMYAFEAFHRLVKKDQTFISIELFGHGKSEASDYSGISRSEWKDLLSHFLMHLGHANFSVLAYSLGGKVALETLNLFPKQINRILLFSPDGFKKNKFYEFLSLSSLGRWTYRRIIKNPDLFLGFTDFLAKIKILPERLKRFVHYHIGDKERREMVYDVYRVYRHFIPNLEKFQLNIEKNKTPISFIFGKHDVIIHHSLANRFIDKLNDKSLAQIHLLNKGHILLDSDSAAYLTSHNLWFQ